MDDPTSVWLTYGAAFAIALYMTAAWRQFRARRVWRAGSTMQIAKISAYQMALMTGGVARVALTGVVRLIGRKVLLPGVAGVLTENGKFHGALDEIERETLEAAKTPALLMELLARLDARIKRKKLVAQLRVGLIAAGYMQSFGSRKWWTNYLQNMLPFAVLLAAAIAAVADVAMTADAQYLLLRFIGGSVVTMLVVALPARVTALGRYIVWSATQHHPDFKTARADHGDSIDVKMLGQSVALYGEDALAGSDMAWIPAMMGAAENTD